MDKNADAKAEEATTGAPSVPGGLESEVELDPEHFDPNSDNVIPTIDEVGGIDLSTGGARPAEKAEGKSAEKAEKAAGGEGDDKGKDAGGDKGGGDNTDAGDPKDKKGEGSSEQEPYHKDPAWQRIITERDQAVSALEALNKRVESLEKTTTTPASEQAGAEGKIPTDINSLSEEELIELQNDNPKEFIRTLHAAVTQQVKAELSSEIATKESEAKIDQTYDAYAGQNPDNDAKTGFVQMWESGVIQQFINQNPGHNPISAHMALTNETSVQAKIDAAVKEATEKVTKQYQARVVTDGLGAGPAHVPAETNELNGTKKKGGLNTVLAGRLRKLRQSTT
jgi:hypothetical protein